MEIAHCFEELVAWQRSVELCDEIIRLTESGRVARDFKFCAQIRNSARSAPRNLAEGFDRFKPREFASYARIARGSLGETRNHILDGRKRAHFSEADAEALLSLARRAHSATTGLLRYLDSCKGVAPTGWDHVPASNATETNTKRPSRDKKP